MNDTTSPPSAAAAATPPPNGKRRVLLTGFLAVVALALGTWATRYVMVGRHHVDTDNAYVAGDIVEVTPQVRGMVQRIHVRETQRVQAGDVLVELDPTDARTQLARAEAELARAVRDVAGLYASTDALDAQADARRADVTAAEAMVARAKADLDRRNEVAAEGGVSAEEVAHATQTLRSAEAQLAAARAGLVAARQQATANRVQTEGTTVAEHPRVRAAAAAVREAFLAEGRTRIVAPVSGEVARNAVTLGAAVQPGTPLLAIIPLERVWVEANYKEGQLGRVRAGQTAVLHADLYGDDVEYTGTVIGLEAGTGSAFALLPAQNASGNWIKVVQRVPVRIALDPRQLAEHPLRIGLSMEADIDTRSTPAEGSAPPANGDATRGTDMYAALEEQAGARVREIIASQRVGAAR
jgi:membrane fusion protein, multidrug efflux system